MFGSYHRLMMGSVALLGLGLGATAQADVDFNFPNAVMRADGNPAGHLPSPYPTQDGFFDVDGHNGESPPGPEVFTDEDSGVTLSFRKPGTAFSGVNELGAADGHAIQDFFHTAIFPENGNAMTADLTGLTPNTDYILFAASWAGEEDFRWGGAVWDGSGTVWSHDGDELGTIINDMSDPDASTATWAVTSNGDGEISLSIAGDGQYNESLDRDAAPIFTGMVVSVIPEPASLALVGVGSLLMLGRRRRAVR